MKLLAGRLSRHCPWGGGALGVRVWRYGIWALCTTFILLLWAFSSTPHIQTSRSLRPWSKVSDWAGSSDLKVFTAASMTPVEYDAIMMLLKDLMRNLKSWKISYYISGGTLLGSYRHHDMIPWDSDADLHIWDHHRQLLIDLLADDVVMDITCSQDQCAVYHRNSDATFPRWPTVTLHFFKKNSTHVWDVSDPNNILQKKVIFPLRERPFGDLWLHSPKEPGAVLRMEYGDLTMCRSPHFDHRTGKAQKNPMSIPCTKFYPVLAFVHRSTEVSPGDDDVEVLMKNERVVRKINIRTSDVTTTLPAPTPASKPGGDKTYHTPSVTGPLIKKSSPKPG